MRKRLASVVGAVVIAAAAESAAQTGPSHASVPLVHSVRASSAIVVNGLLDDEVWLRAAPVTTFTQRDPDEGKPPTEATEVRFLYDDDALYVAARMHDREPARIARRLSRRDDERGRRQLHAHPRPDARPPDRRDVPRQRGQRAAGRHLYNDTWTDNSWDAVWESAVRIDDDGWTAEMRIPLSQLRFSAASQHTSGVNVERYIRRKNEDAWLVLVPKTESGMASRMAHLDGLDGVAPRRTVELLPYLVESRRVSSRRDRRQSVQRRRARLRERRARLEVAGHQQPDARRHDQSRLRPGRSRSGRGQPHRVRDLLRGEAPVLHRGGQHLQQLRPWRRQQFLGLQSRRADALLLAAHRPRSPQGDASGDFVETPTATTILGAAKLTGKTRNGWSLGAARCGDRRASGRKAVTSASTQRNRSRADHQLLRRPRRARVRTAGRGRGAGDGGQPRSAGAGAASRSGGAVLRRRCRRARVPRRQARLGDHRRPRGQSSDREYRGDHAAAEPVATLLRSTRCCSRGARLGGDIAQRLDRQRQPESQRRDPHRQRRVVGGQPRLRLERRRLHLRRRSRRDARGVSVAQSQGHALRAPPVLRGGQVVHVELRA